MMLLMNNAIILIQKIKTCQVKDNENHAIVHETFLTFADNNIQFYLFLMGAVNPRASEVINLSMGRPVPANAQAPRGQKFILTRQSSKRLASRSSYNTSLNQ